MDPKNIISHCRKNYTSVDFCEDVVNDGESITIYAFARDEKENRVCPFCNSKDVIIKDRPKVRIKYSVFLCENLPVFIELTKIKYKCKNCEHIFTPQVDLLPKRSSISNDTRWSVYRLSSEVITFKTISKILNISLPTTINIFDKMVHYASKKMPKVLCIDEKGFKTSYGKYICVLSDGENGDIIDVLPGRTVKVLDTYFNKIPENDRKNVEFLASDMFEGYRTIKNEYFKKSVHVIDYFHISNLFRNTINIIRVEYMKHYGKESYIYQFLSSKRKTFLSPQLYSKKKEIYNTEYVTDDGEVLDYNSMLKRIYELCPNLLEIKILYNDSYNLLDKNAEEDDIREALEFLINKAKLSTVTNIRIIGYTLQNFFNEIVDTYSISNYLHVSNAVAEGNNRFIDSIINISYGLKSFKRLRNRIMHCKAYSHTKNP